MNEAATSLFLSRNRELAGQLAEKRSKACKGGALVEEMFGTSINFREREPRQFYSAGWLHPGDDCFLEVLGPNSVHRIFNPIKQRLKWLKAPAPPFSYMCATDSVAAAKRSRPKLQPSNGAARFSVSSIVYEGIASLPAQRNPYFAHLFGDQNGRG